MYLETWRIVMIILVSAWFFGIMGWVIGYIQGWHWGQGLTLSGEIEHFKLAEMTPERLAWLQECAEQSKQAERPICPKHGSRMSAIIVDAGDATWTDWACSSCSKEMEKE